MCSVYEQKNPVVSSTQKNLKVRDTVECSYVIAKSGNSLNWSALNSDKHSSDNQTARRLS